ncbi:MAG: glycosyltransferase [bacterium]
MKNTPQRIAYVIDSLSFGGAERQVSILARSLPSHYRPLVVSLAERLDPFGNDLRERGIDVAALPRRCHNDIGRLWHLTGLLKRAGVGVVHGWLDAANAYAYPAGRMLRLPVVLSLRNEILRVSGGKASVLAWMLRHADGVLVNSKKGKTYLESIVRVNPRKILHVGNWVDPESRPGVRDIPGTDEPPTIGFVGRFAKQKRLPLLLAAFRQVHDLVPGSRLILMGGGSERDALVRRAAHLGIENRVEFVDPDPDVGRTLRRIHVFALPSAFEGLPNAAIEAMAMGIPVIATRVGDLEDLIVEGNTGL